MTARDDIAIVGIGLRVPGAADVDAFWRNVRDGVVSTSRFDRDQLLASGVPPDRADAPGYVPVRGTIEAAEAFDAHFFNYSPREALAIDPQQRVFLEVVWHALEDAGIDPASFEGTIGIFAGIGLSAHLLREWFAIDDRERRPETIVLGADKDFVATRVAYKLNLTGPAVTVQTACSSSLTAVHAACQSLLLGDCDVAIAGGVSVKVPQEVGYFYEEGDVHSPEGVCRPYDADANGMIGGNGAAVVVLRRGDEASAAGQRVYALIRGSAVNNDGSSKLGFTAPSVTGQAKVIVSAQELADVDPRTIGFVEGHGTGTALGDPAEIEALTAAFRSRTKDGGFCALGSVKANIGHLDTAAGVIGLVKAALALRHRVIPPLANFRRPPAYLDGSPFYVPLQAQPWNSDGPRRAGVTSLGIGGTNVHVVLEEAERSTSSRLTDAEEQLLVLSARTGPALQAARAALAQHLQSAHDTSLADVATTLQLGRHAFEHRWSGVCASPDEAIGALESDLPGTTDVETSPIAPVFLFAGGGAPVSGVGAKVSARSDAARDTFARGEAAYQRITGRSLAEAASGGTSPSDVPLAVSLPALLVYEVAVARFLIELGVVPAAMIGHSLGEYAAACIAGVFDLEDALAVVVERGRLLDSLPEGAMLSVSLPEAELQSHLTADVSVAAANAPDTTVVAGPVAAIDALEARLTASGIDTSRVPIRIAAHSAMLEPVLDAFRAMVASVALRPPQLPFMSSLTGTWIEREQAMSPDYWVRQFRHCVRFTDAVSTALTLPGATFVDVGPGRTLGSAAGAHGVGEQRPVVASLGRHPREAGTDWAALLRGIGRLWTRGMRVDWARLQGDGIGSQISLPGYAFDRTIFPAVRRLPAVVPQRELERRAVDEWCYAAAWRPVPAPVVDPQNADRTILLFVNDDGLTDDLDRAVRERASHVISIRRGATFRPIDADAGAYEVSASVDDQLLLLRALAARGLTPSRIVHAWSVAAPSALDGSARFDEEHARGTAAVVALVQALDQIGVTTPIELIVAAAGLEDTNGTEPVVAERSTLAGLRPVVAQEYPHITCRLVDVALGALRQRSSALVDALCAEALGLSREPRVALRGARRLEHHWVPYAAESTAAGCRRGGAYAVIGGLGRVGRSLARHLLTEYGAKLLLVGRRSAEELDGPQSALALLRDEAAAAGGAILYVAADVTDSDALGRALAHASERFGTIDGVIHAAGSVRQRADTSGRALGELSDRDFRQQLHAKVEGLYALEQALRNRDVGFCLICSSLASTLGGLGFGAYAAANAFADAFAIDRARGEGGPRWIAVDWDAWDVDADPSTPTRGRQEPSMPVADALRVFEWIVAGRVSGQLAVSTVDVEARTRAASVAAPPDAPSQDRRPAATTTRPALRSSFVAPSTETERLVADAWQAELGIAPIGTADSFFDLGGHSLLATRIVHRLRKQLGMSLPLRLLFEQPTVAGLAAHIDRLQTTQPAPVVAPTAIGADAAARFEPFPLTDVQEAYWIGRRADMTLGSVATHSYIEIDAVGLDPIRLQAAWDALVRRHDMLRVVILEDGRQQIVPDDVRFEIPVIDLRDAGPGEAIELARLRDEMSHQVLRTDRFPLFDLRLSQRSAGRVRLHVSLDRLVCDAWSTQILARDLFAAYEGRLDAAPPLEIAFRDYVVQAGRLVDTPERTRARDYWMARLDTLPPAPPLPLAINPSRVAKARFQRRAVQLDPAESQRFAERSAAAGVTPSSVLLAAFSHVLARWANATRFTVNLTLFNRAPVHPQINDIVGDFTSITLLESDPTYGEPFSVFAARLQGRLWEDVDHRQFNGIEVIRELRRLKGAQAAALPVVFTSTLGLAADGEGAARKLGQITYSITQTPQVWLDHQVFQRDSCLTLLWDAVDELFPAGLLDEMFAAYRALVQQLVSSESAWTESGRALLNGFASSTLRSHEESRPLSEPVACSTLDRPFALRVVERPAAAAVCTSTEVLNYAGLAALTASGARALCDAGVRRGELVAVMMDKSARQVAALLSIVSVGAAYLPIETTLPVARVRHLLREARVRIVLTDSDTADAVIWPRELSIVTLDDDGRTGAGGAPGSVSDPKSLAYVIFTSGSTGAPKGVMIEHRAAMNTIVDINARFDVGPADRVLALSSPAFDLSVYDVFGLLAAGGAIVMPSRDETRDPAAWARLIDTHCVTIWNSVPALMDLLLDYYEAEQPPAKPSLRLILLSGDWIPLSMPARIARVFPSARVVSLGGATEASIWSNYHEIVEVAPDAASIPYGRALEHQKLVVLDRWLDRCPTWVPGEICIGGAGVATGYWEDRERTARRFIPDPDGDGRVYRTGDLGRLLPNGEIEILGRLDHQVKVHGHRIELGEIESRLNTHPTVRESIVVAAGAQTERRLVAFVVPAPDRDVDVTALNRYILEWLPRYMAPERFVVLDDWPLTGNGKIDRARLAELAAAAPETRTTRPPTWEEQAVAGAFAEILLRSDLPPDASFFHLGGDSVKAVRLLTRLRRDFGAPLTLRDVFEHPTVEAMSARIGEVRLAQSR